MSVSDSTIDWVAGIISVRKDLRSNVDKKAVDKSCPHGSLQRADPCAPHVRVAQIVAQTTGFQPWDCPVIPCYSPVVAGSMGQGQVIEIELKKVLPRHVVKYDLGARVLSPNPLRRLQDFLLLMKVGRARGLQCEFLRSAAKIITTPAHRIITLCCPTGPSRNDTVGGRVA